MEVRCISLRFIKSEELLTMVNVLFSVVTVLAALLLTCHACLHEEARSLLLFKKRMLDFNTSNDYFSQLSTWEEGSDCCRNWEGVVCNPLTHHVQSLDSSYVFYNEEVVAIQDCETLLPLSNLQGLTSLDMSSNLLNVSLVLRCLGKFPSLSEINLLDNYDDSSISSAFQEWPSEALQRLTGLYLGGNLLSGSLPPQLQNMTSLAYLILSGNNFTSDFHELCSLSNLRGLSLWELNPDKVAWSAWNFSRLVELSLASCSLQQHHIEQMKWLKRNKGMEYLTLDDNMLKNISFIGHFPHLRGLSASNNSIEGRIPESIGKMMNLQALDLGSNNLVGRIPESIGNMMNLQTLDLHSNNLVGRIPESIGNMMNFQALYLGSNNLVGRIPMSLGNLSLLAYLDLSNNSLSGSIPYTLSKLSKLQYLDVSYNQLNESSALFSLPSSLEIVILGENRMNGTISEYLFSNLTKVDTLDLTRSGSSISISNTWIPNFSCRELLLGSCKINGPFPEWISVVTGIYNLDLSNTSLYGQIPPWLWELPQENIASLNLSYNELEGHVPHLGRFHIVDLSFNKLNGPLPALLTSSKSLGDEDEEGGSLYFYFKNNNFEGPLPTSVSVQVLTSLDASNNRLTGTIPRIYSNCSSLEFLNLANNNLNGSLLIHFGSNLQSLRSLTLFNNNLEGELPKSLSGCSQLRVLNIGNNFFQGQFPKWISQLKQLRILEMRSNRLNGNFPEDLNTMSHLHFIDVSSNQLSGPIPKSISALPGMLNEVLDNSSENFSANSVVEDPDIGGRGFPLITFQDIELNVKGLYLPYPRILSALTCIDLSNNHLTGEIPRDLDKLKGLKYLNLSRNHLTGPIPASIGKMTGLEELDLSSNEFSGSIPNEFVGLNSMGFLNLSYNNLSGRIPRGGQMLTFGAQYFEGNLNLTDPLLLLVDKKKRMEAQTTGESEESGGHDQEFWWAITVGVSFGVGFATFVSAWVLESRFRKYVNSSMDPIILWLLRSRY